MKVRKNKKSRNVIIEDKWSISETKEAIEHLHSVLLDLQRKSGEHKNPKVFYADWNDIDSLNTVHKSLRGRVLDLKAKSNTLTRDTRTDIFKRKWDAIQSILATDLTFLYEQYDFDATEKYYVYAHCDMSKPIAVESKNPYDILSASLGMSYRPFYIGKGIGDRYLKGDRNRNYSKIKRKSIDIDKVVVKRDLSECRALEYETKLIDVYGLAIHGGTLINIDEGIGRDHRRHLYGSDLAILRKIEDIL